MDKRLKSAILLFAFSQFWSVNVSTSVTVCQGQPPEKGNTTLSCNAILHEPVCFICNASTVWKDVSWFAEDMILADGIFNFEASHAGKLVINGCPEFGNKSLKLERPTVENHNSLYYCRHNKKIVSLFVLRLHVEAVLSINTSRASEGKLILRREESEIALQCVLDKGYPPVVLFWSLNNATIGRKIFDQLSNETATFDYTITIQNLKTKDTVICTSEGTYIESDNASLQIVVVRHEEDFIPTSTPTTGKGETTSLHKTWILTSLFVVLLLSFSTLIFVRRYNKKTSFNINNTNRNDIAESDGTLYDQYSEIGHELEREDSAKDDEYNGIENVSLISQLTIGGVFEYWIGAFIIPGIKEEKCFAKLLSGQATLQEASEFQTLAKRMKGLRKSTSIVRLICININENPFSILYELMEYGTLRDFVMARYQQPPTSTTDGEGTDLERQITELLTFATNVANAMLFVQSQNFRHPVLSLRKVLLTSRCCCKLYDIYPSDMTMAKIHQVRRKVRVNLWLLETCVNHPPLPWMSPETIFLHQYSPASDVWSFSTFLWELFTLGEMPFAGNESMEIEDKIRGGVVLSKPPNCPGALYEIMLLAWSKSSTARPSFQEMLVKFEDMLKSFEENETTTGRLYLTLEPNQSNEYI